jgi:hypothetical protein
MKLTKDRFSTWEDLNDKDYEIEFDDELIIKVYPKESSKDIADYILSLQDDLDRLLIKHDEVREELGNMKFLVFSLKEEKIILQDELEHITETNKTCAMNCANMAVENGQLKSTLDEIKKLDLSKVIRFTGTIIGDQHEEHNDIINVLVNLLGDKE